MSNQNLNIVRNTKWILPKVVAAYKFLSQHHKDYKRSRLGFRYWRSLAVNSNSYCSDGQMTATKRAAKTKPVIPPHCILKLYTYLNIHVAINKHTVWRYWATKICKKLIPRPNDTFQSNHLEKWLLIWLTLFILRSEVAIFHTIKLY
jgi:hypothetical protein